MRLPYPTGICWPKGGSGGNQARTFRGKDADYPRQDRNRAVSQLRNSHASGKCPPRSSRSTDPERNHWIMCPEGSHQKQMSELQTVQPQSTASNGADQRQRFYHHGVVSSRIPWAGGILSAGLQSAQPHGTGRDHGSVPHQDTGSQIQGVGAEGVQEISDDLSRWQEVLQSAASPH